MARRPKSKEVSSFGGVQHMGNVHDPNITPFVSEMSQKTSLHENTHYDLQSIEVQSETHLEDDHGGGGAAIIRMFEFGANPEAFSQMKPTKQELFNSHYKGIELALWRAGMKVIPEVNPRIIVDSKNGKYQIFVGAQPMKGHTLTEQPKTLSQQIHG